jgi:hypothetical protein
MPNLTRKRKGNEMIIERFSSKGFMVYLTQDSNNLINRVEQKGDVLKSYVYYAGNSKGNPCTAKKYRDNSLAFINKINTALI